MCRLLKLNGLLWSKHEKNTCLINHLLSFLSELFSSCWTPPFINTQHITLPYTYMGSLMNAAFSICFGLSPTHKLNLRKMELFRFSKNTHIDVEVASTEESIYAQASKTFLYNIWQGRGRGRCCFHFADILEHLSHLDQQFNSSVDYINKTIA